jgi:hypothetical protein
MKDYKLKQRNSALARIDETRDLSIGAVAIFEGWFICIRIKKDENRG